MVSASLPLKGRDAIAVNVKAEMISPFHSPPPSAAKNAGSLGMIMLKLPKNNKELKQINQNCEVYMVDLIKA